MEDEANHPEPAFVKPKPRWYFYALIFVLIVILAGGGYFGYEYWRAKRTEAAKPAQFVPNFDFDHGLTRVIKAADGGKLTVIDYQNVAITLQIPPGGLTQDIKISLLPIKKTGDLKTDPGVYILPSDQVFVKAATINYDFSNSKIKNENAIESNGNNLSFSSDSHVYRVNYINHTYMPQLVARAAETKESLTSEILGTGVYVYSLDGKRQIQNAETAFESKRPNNAALLESATTLLYSGQKLNDKQSKLTNGAMRSVYTAKNPDPFEIYAAIQLDNLQNGKGPGFWQKLVDSVHAEVLPGLIEYTCKTTSRDPDELYSVWMAAQALGREDAAESCMNTIKNIISQDIQKLLDDADPRYTDLLKAEQNAQKFGLDNFTEPLQKKEHDKAVREAENLLKDNNASVNLIFLALQNVLQFAQDKTNLITRLEERKDASIGIDVDRVLNDPYATAADIVRAMQKNDTTNNANKDEVRDRLQGKLNNRVRDEAVSAMGDPNTTMADYLALASQAEACGLADLSELMKKKAADAPGRPPVSIDIPTPPQEEDIPYTGPSAFNEEAAALEAIGLKSFDEEGFTQWADDFQQQAQDASTMAGAECAAQGGGLLCEVAKGLIQWLGQAVHDGATEFGQEVGEVQARPEDLPVPYDGVNDHDRITGNCIGKEEAASMQPYEADIYTLCPGVTKADFGKRQQEEDNLQNEVWNADHFDKTKCIQAFPVATYAGYCDWMEGMWNARQQETSNQNNAASGQYDEADSEPAESSGSEVESVDSQPADTPAEPVEDGASVNNDGTSAFDQCLTQEEMNEIQEDRRSDYHLCN